ncbi:MAG: hypothetical protein U0361_02855 [Nitrospiraceae bacterium]
MGLFLLGLPLLDTVGVMMQRLKEGRSPRCGQEPSSPQAAGYGIYDTTKQY